MRLRWNDNNNEYDRREIFDALNKIRSAMLLSWVCLLEASIRRDHIQPLQSYSRDCSKPVCTVHRQLFNKTLKGADEQQGPQVKGGKKFFGLTEIDTFDVTNAAF